MNMHYYDGLISELAELCGILPEYWDISGKKHVTSLDTKKDVLKAMGLHVDSADATVKTIYERRWRIWRNFVEPVHVVSVNARPVTIPVYIPATEDEERALTISWSTRDEKGHVTEHEIRGSTNHVLEEQWIDGKRYVRTHLTFEQNVPGYYTLDIECRYPGIIASGKTGSLRKSSRLIIAPDTCYIPPELQNGRAWGISMNLYAMRSEKNWGIGDFADLRHFVQWSGDLHFGFVGINPLHAISNSQPFGISPYSPISRLYRNFIYLDLEEIPEVMESESNRKLMASPAFRKELDAVREADFVDYEKVSALKEKVLRNAFDHFYGKHFRRNTKRCRDFKRYISEEGKPLDHFSTFMALYHYFTGQGTKGRKQPSPICYSWQEWPEQYRNPDSKETRLFKKQNMVDVLFYQYLQWLLDEQLREISADADNTGTGAGLYFDLAVGSVCGGSDAWSYQDVIAIGANVGAPPDDFSPAGQKWGFPPMIPDKLKETGYELFIQTLRKNMKHGKTIRIDHALGLFRLFWIPEGMTPKEGAYVTYPADDLLRIIALESVRNKTMVVAEDLGTIGENVREALKKFQMLSYRLLYFERNYPDPSFLPPDKYPEMALCAVTTHDLPTLTGYWKARDIEVRKDLGQYSDPDIWKKQACERERDKKLLLKALISRGVLPDDHPTDPVQIPAMTPVLCRAVYQYLAQTPCTLLLVSLDDIISTLNQQNMPGTVDTHPNWVQKTILTREQIMRDRRFNDLAGMLNSIMKLR